MRTITLDNGTTLHFDIKRDSDGRAHILCDPAEFVAALDWDAIAIRPGTDLDEI